jgi:hypothetical protein
MPHSNQLKLKDASENVSSVGKTLSAINNPIITGKILRGDLPGTRPVTSDSVGKRQVLAHPRIAFRPARRDIEHLDRDTRTPGQRHGETGVGRYDVLRRA